MVIRISRDSADRKTDHHDQLDLTFHRVRTTLFITLLYFANVEVKDSGPVTFTMLSYAGSKHTRPKTPGLARFAVKPRTLGRECALECIDAKDI